MPLTAGAFGAGKIVGPLLCEAQVNFFGIALVFYTFIVVTGILMFVVILLNKHLGNIDEVEKLPLIVEQDDELDINNNKQGQP